MINVGKSFLKTNFLKDKFLFFLIVLHLIYFVYRVVLNNYLVLPDSIEYFTLAENILNHSEFYCSDLNSNIEPEYYTKRPPLYSLFIILSSLFLKSKISVLFFQGVLSLVGIIIIKNIFEDLMGKPNRVFLYIFILASLSQFIFSNMIMSEIFLQFLIVLTIFTIHLLLKRNKLKFLFFYQFLIILLFLTKPVFYLFVIPNILLTYLICRSIKYKMGTLTSFLPILIVLLYFQWNFERTESYNFSSMQHINLIDYNLRYFNTNKYGAEYAEKINDSIVNTAKGIDGYNNQVKFINSTSLNYLKKDVASYTLFHLIGSLKMLVDPGRFDLIVFFNFNHDMISEVGFLKHFNEGGLIGALKFLKAQPLTIIVLFNLILLINLFKLSGFLWFLIRLLKKSPLIIWIMFVFIGYIAIITGPIGAARFVVPILPLYLFLSLYGFSNLLTTIKSYWTKTSFTSPSS